MVSALLLSCALGVAGAAEPEAVKPPGPDLAAYQAAKTAAGRDADAHVKLALWCEAHGMTAERTQHLTRAVLLDPSHAKARGLLGFVDHEGKWLRPDEVARAVEESPERRALFQEYLERRTKARDKADDQYKLALWCEDNGLPQQMTAHLHRVLELDPGRDGAWRRLGFKKSSGRWVNPEVVAAAKAEHDAQSQADKLWKPRLEKLKDALAGRDKAKKAEALEAVARIDDPRAVPMVWHVFAKGGERNQLVAAGIFGQIEAPSASNALAMMAVFSPIADVRSDAAQLLSRRDPREFAGLLAGLIQDEVKYKVKQVEGPGSQGELFVEGKEANVKRLYTPLQTPTMLPGDVLSVNGYESVIFRPLGTPYAGNRFSPNASFNEARKPDFAKVSALLQPAGVPASVSREIATRISDSQPQIFTDANVNNMPSFDLQEIRQNVLQVPIGQMMREAQASAMLAQQKLAQDVQQLESHNAPIREINERASAILRNISGVDLGADGEKWTAWAVDLQGYAFRSESQTSTPVMIVEDVPLNFQSQVVPAITSQVVGYRQVHSCFAAGTSVRTLLGPRPIEDIRPGDQVLTEDTASGAFRYQPVVVVYHNPPNETYRLDLGKEAVVATGIHRFWKAGQGWVMARDVKAGDRLRTIGGTAEVVSVAKDQVQPVFNLQLAGGDNFCVGEQGLVAHDNSFVDPVAEPFDGVPALADLASSRTP